MKTIYSIQFHIKYELAKLTLIILLSIFYCPIYDLLENSLCNTFDSDNLLYINRILFIVLIFGLIVLVSARFANFSSQNDESLILLGIGALQRCLLFFFKNYEILFLQLYFGAMVYQIEHISVLVALPTNIINALFVYASGILIALKARSRSFSLFTLTLIIISGALIGSRRLTYHVVYRLIMSKGTEQLLFSSSAFPFIIKLAATLCLIFIAVFLYKHADAGLSHKGIHANHFNMFGDFIHKLSKYPLYSKNYFGMYQHKDYLLWKLFSSILLIISCFTVNNNLVIFLIVYGICLITSFYYKDIYNFEQNLLFIYFMSNYPYRKLMSDFMISGLFILGDNILLILLIRCIVSPTTILVLVATGAMVVFISLFVNSCLFVKYPTKKSYINILLILIKLHLPILNLLFLYKNSKTGKQNWENLIYEHIQ